MSDPDDADRTDTVDGELLIYGVTGSTGERVARAAREGGLRPTLAGRSADGVARVGSNLDLPTRVFDLTGAGVRDAVADADAVLNCAGPFDRTADPLATACLDAGTHYLDLSGEVPEFQTLLGHHEAALDAGVTLLPGVGFGVVPTDCLAGFLAAELPSATELTLAFRTVGGVSRGTARTLLGDVLSPGAVRRDGRLRRAFPAAERRVVDFGDGRRSVVTNPWRGDLVTAYHSAGIETIHTFWSVPLPVRLLMRASPVLGRVWNSAPVQSALDRLVASLPAGPDDSAAASGRTDVWGEVRDDRGGRVTARLHGPEAYRFTALTAVDCARRVLSEPPGAGFQTPSTAFGPDFVLDVEGVSRERLA